MRFSASFSSRGRKNRMAWGECYQMSCWSSQWICHWLWLLPEWMWFIHMSPVMLTVCLCVHAHMSVSSCGPLFPLIQCNRKRINTILLSNRPSATHPATPWTWTCIFYIKRINTLQSCAEHDVGSEMQSFINSDSTITWKENERIHKLCFTACMCWKPSKQDLWNTDRAPTDPFSADCRWDTLKMFIFIHLLCVCVCVWINNVSIRPPKSFCLFMMGTLTTRQNYFLHHKWRACG